MEIIKKGIEKRFYPETTPNPKGYVVHKFGCDLFIVDSAKAFWADRDCVVVTAVYCTVTDSFLSVTFQLFDGDIIAKGAIIDEEGVEQYKIKIIKFL